LTLARNGFPLSAVKQRTFGAAVSPGRLALWVGLSCLILWAAGALARNATDEKQKQREAADALFNDGTILRLLIEVPPAQVDQLKSNARRYVRATVRDGTTVYTNVAIHLKGSAGSYRNIGDKVGMTLNFEVFEPNAPRFHGLKKLHLNNSVQDPTWMSELICGHMFRAAGVPAARAAHALVDLNGTKLGLYVLMESMDKDFLSLYFRTPRGNLYGQSGGCEVTDNIERMGGEGPRDWQDLHVLAAAVQEKDPIQRLQRVQERLDVDRFLSFMSLEVMLCHWDGYTFARHNYRVFYDMDARRSVFFPHDMDQMIGDPNIPVIPGVNGLVCQAILNTPDLRARYQDRFLDIFKNVFVVSDLTNRITQAVAHILPTVKAYNPDIARDLVNNTEGLKSRIVNREDGLKKQIAQIQGKPVKFESNVAKLSGWHPENDQNGAQLDQVKDKEGKRTLWIKANGATASSWRARFLLDPGTYRFEGLARTAGVQAVKDEMGEGAGLRCSQSRQPRANHLTGVAPWENLTFEFEVGSPREDIELVCELRATKGETWFDAESLKLVRLK